MHLGKIKHESKEGLSPLQNARMVTEKARLGERKLASEAPLSGRENLEKEILSIYPHVAWKVLSLGKHAS